MKETKCCDIKRSLMLLTVTVVLGFPKMAMAYVGPGAGLTLIGSLIGLLIAVLTALGIILFWPIRALIRRIRGKKQVISTEENLASDTVQESSPEAVTKDK
jgi:hypothetical protein